jgi:hypothetical protein
MKLKITALFIIPVLIMAVDLNDDAAIWTQDQGFFQTYREIMVRALEVDGDVVIWGKEVELPSRVMVFDPYNHYLVTQFNEFDITLEVARIEVARDSLLATDIFRKSDLASPWVLNRTGVSRKIVNSLSYHNAIPTGYLVAATERGLFQSSNGGASWSGVKFTQLNSNISDAVLCPVNQSIPGLFGNTYYAASFDGVYKKTRGTSPLDNWEILPRIIEDQDFEDADPGNLNVLPDGWTQSGVDNEYKYVRLDTLNAYSGDYSLLIYSAAVGGNEVAARYAMPDVDLLVCGFEFSPLVHSGVIEIKNNGLGLKVAYRYDKMSYYTTDDGWVEIEGSGVADGMFNELKFVFDFENGLGIMNTFDSLSGDLKTTDTIELYSADDTISEAVFSTESFGYESQPYWIDDFYAQPEVYSLAPHPNSIDSIYAGTPFGIYTFDGSEWAKSLDVEDKWMKLKTDLTGNYMVAASHNQVYMSDNQGVSWNNVSGDIPSINDIYVNTDGTIYAATDSFAYKYDGSWTVLNTSSFLEQGVLEQVRLCKAITMMGPDTIIVGNHNGIYVSVDGGNTWLEDNEGIEPYPIEPAIIEEVDDFFENAINSDSTIGLLDFLTNDTILGDIPDVDNDGLLHVVLLDIYEDGVDASTAFFDPVNVDTLEQYSNKMEMIYVDVDSVVGWPYDPDNARDVVTRELVDMIEWNYDPDEVSWIVNGFEEYGVYLQNYGKGGVFTPFPFTTSNLLTTRSLNHLFIQYLRDKFEDDILKELNEATGNFYDPQTDLTEVRLLQGIEAIDTLLADRTPVSFVDAFKNWGLFCYMDSLEHVKNISFNVDIVGSAPTEAAQTFYSVRARRVLDLTNPLVFSGNDNNDFNLYIIKYLSSGGIESEEVEASEFSDVSRNLHVINLDAGVVDSFDVLTEVISNRGTHPGLSFYNLSLDQTSDDIDMIGIIQSPLADRFLRIYYYTVTERLIDAGVEGGTIIFGDGTSDLSLMTASSEEGYRVYYGDIVLPPGDIVDTLKFLSEDISGNKYEPEYQLKVKSMGAEGGFIVSADNSFRVDILKDALDKTYRITACNIGNNSYYIGPNKSLNVNAILSIDVSNNESKELSIYRKEGNNWIEIPCVRKGNTLQAEITTLGEFSIKEGSLVTDVPLTLELSTKTLDPYEIKYAVPEKGNVRIDVYNALGQRINTLVNGVLEPGYYKVNWNARTENNELVGNGVYFYRISAVSETLTKKIVVVR